MTERDIITARHESSHAVIARLLDVGVKFYAFDREPSTGEDAMPLGRAGNRRAIGAD